MKIFIPRFIGAILYFVVLTIIGTIGYAIIEGAAIFDAFYMTVITVSSVGYAEHVALTQASRSFTVVLLFFGVTGLGIWFALITSFIVELDLKDAFRRRRMDAEVGKLKDHIIVCGAGRTGWQVMEELLLAGEPFVVIERDKERIERIHNQLPDVLVVAGDATNDHNLEEAGILRAKGLLSCLSGETDNVFVCLSARHLTPDLNIVARAFEDETIDKLYRAGANHVVSPNVSGAIRMTAMLLKPEVLDFLDVSTRSQGLSLRFEQAAIEEDSPVAGMTLAEARIPEKTGLVVIAVRAKGGDAGDFRFNPTADVRLSPGDDVVVLGEADQIQKLNDYLNG